MVSIIQWLTDNKIYEDKHGQQRQLWERHKRNNSIMQTDDVSMGMTKNGRQRSMKFTANAIFQVTQVLT